MNLTDDWRHSAACLTHDDPELWFRDDTVRADDINDTHYAKTICREDCPVREECLREALTKRYEHGVWGGLDGQERRSLIRRQQRKADPPMKPETRQRIRDAHDMWHHGLTMTEIGTRLGVHEETVRKYLREGAAK